MESYNKVRKFNRLLRVLMNLFCISGIIIWIWFSFNIGIRMVGTTLFLFVLTEGIDYCLDIEELKEDNEES